MQKSTEPTVNHAQHTAWAGFAGLVAGYEGQGQQRIVENRARTTCCKNTRWLAETPPLAPPPAVTYRDRQQMQENNRLDTNNYEERNDQSSYHTRAHHKCRETRGVSPKPISVPLPNATPFCFKGTSVVKQGGSRPTNQRPSAKCRARASRGVTHNNKKVPHTHVVS